MLSGALVTSMTDRIFVIAAAAVLIAVAASISRYYFVAIIAALVGAGAIALDRYADFGQSPASAAGESVRMGFHGSPVAWSGLYINSAAASQPGNLSNVSTLSVMGKNVSEREIRLDEVYFLSDLDGTKLNAQIGWGGARYKIRDMGPLPPGALFFVVSDPLGPTDAGLGPSAFLKAWATISFVARYNGTTQTIEFDRQTVESALPKP